MVDSISGVGGKIPTPIKSDPAKSDSSHLEPGLNKAANTETESNTDRIELSAEAKTELDKAGFDSEKVERIKQALSDGNYPIDARKIAEGFADIEKLL
ncbi:flagellar biosynthesis anti-sigma factor FlgM [Litorivicinus sp.]|jgi:negative regulator of flagellin synthesis FlgM|nr:flagellar biosynthesis anti-sigma factor FlgM [Litorivicinus sp.]|tara:strand:+ start:520 stop:813 length:294 start_codon:yes stop_codon:yes gene_type:complete